ncbi:hypothetical protein BDQ17DRAFT_1425513 [Cyathus striatus]|nr:hypothetical protein BDQ17DRAFT_1425513 [Cyathus striatus]
MRFSQRLHAGNLRVEELQQQLEDGATQLSETRHHSMELQQKLDAKEAQLSKVWCQYKELQKRTEEIEVSLDAKDKQLDEARQHCEELQQGLRKLLGSSLGAKNTQISEAQIRYEELRGRLRGVESDLNMKNKLLFETRMRCDELEGIRRKEPTLCVSTQELDLVSAIERRLRVDTDKCSGTEPHAKRRVNENQLIGQLVSILNQNHSEVLQHFSQISEELHNLPLGKPISHSERRNSGPRGVKRKREEVIDLTENFESLDVKMEEVEFALKLGHKMTTRSDSLRSKGKEREA